MRLFAAVELPEPVRAAIAEGQAALRRALPAARWVRPEGVHVTLKFLGEQPEDLPSRLDAALAAPLAALAPVQVRLDRAGFFPDPKRARVAWLGGAAPGLDAWAGLLEEAAAAAGVPRERRSFALHLTLARLERPWPPAAAERFVAAVEGWRLPAFAAREVVLFASRLAPGGAVYTPQRRWPVGKGRHA